MTAVQQVSEFCCRCAVYTHTHTHTHNTQLLQLKHTVKGLFYVSFCFEFQERKIKQEGMKK